MYNIDSRNFGGRTGSIFLGTTILQLIARLFMVPDTTKLAVEQIDHAFYHGYPPRRFRKIMSERQYVLEEKKLDVLFSTSNVVPLHVQIHLQHHLTNELNILSLLLVKTSSLSTIGMRGGSGQRQH
jgi:hypothetical protein